MSPITHHAHLVAELLRAGQILELDHSLAFLRAETLARVLDRAGMHAVCEVCRDADALTLVLHVSAPPPAITEALDERGLAHKVLDFRCDHQVTQSWFEVDVFGTPIIIYTQIALVEPEQRAALITKKAA